MKFCPCLIRRKALENLSKYDPELATELLRMDSLLDFDDEDIDPRIERWNRALLAFIPKLHDEIEKEK
jgi:hypothetical protein